MKPRTLYWGLLAICAAGMAIFVYLLATTGNPVFAAGVGYYVVVGAAVTREIRRPDGR